MRELWREARNLKEVVAEQTLEMRLLKKKHDRGWGVRGMRYPAPEKMEIIKLVERLHLPAKQTLDRRGIARPTFYRWYDLYLCFGEDALKDNRPIVTPIALNNRRIGYATFVFDPV